MEYNLVQHINDLQFDNLRPSIGQYFVAFEEGLQHLQEGLQEPLQEGLQEPPHQEGCQSPSRRDCKSRSRRDCQSPCRWDWRAPPGGTTGAPPGETAGATPGGIAGSSSLSGLEDYNENIILNIGFVYHDGSQPHQFSTSKDYHRQIYYEACELSIEELYSKATTPLKSSAATGD